MVLYMMMSTCQDETIESLSSLATVLSFVVFLLWSDGLVLTFFSPYITSLMLKIFPYFRPQGNADSDSPQEPFIECYGVTKCLKVARISGLKKRKCVVSD